MQAQKQQSSDQSTPEYKTLEVRLDAVHSFEMLSKLETVEEAVVTLQVETPDEKSFNRTSVREKAYQVHIKGEETCHRLILNVDGTYHFKSFIGI